jgi:hypothetical protein
MVEHALIPALGGLRQDYGKSPAWDTPCLKKERKNKEYEKESKFLRNLKVYLYWIDMFIAGVYCTLRTII